MKKIITIIGDSQIKENDLAYQLAYRLGTALIDHQYRIMTGGLGGVQLAVCHGAKQSKHYNDGDTIAILPSFDKQDANIYSDIIIPTGLDLARNIINVSSDAVIVIGGKAGTLSEIASAWSLFKLIIAFTQIPGWGADLAGKKVDNRQRYESIPEDQVYPVKDPKEVIDLLEIYIPQYNKAHHGIKWRKN
jgi:uncharacterized protein (TIGR00725 family)